MSTCCKKFSLIVPLLALAIVAVPALAQNCLQNEYNLVNKQKLGCTANDVRVAKVINTRNPNGTPINSCIAGQPFSFVADFLVTTTSSSARENIGLYFSEFDASKQPTALTGSCSDNIIAPPHHSSNPAVTTCLGSGAYNDPTCTGFGTYETFGAPESTTGSTSCGDTSSSDGTVCLGPADALGNAAAVPCPAPAGGSTFTSTQVITVEITNFTCPNEAAGTQVQLPNCTSWQEPGAAITCTTSSPDYPYPFNGPGGTPTAIPGAPSKCNCATVSLPIIVQTPSIVVQKACEPGASGTPNPPTFNPTTTPTQQSPVSCNAGPEGENQITYTVALTNNSNVGGVTVDQICDNVYGTIYRSSSAPAGLAFCNGAASEPPFTGDSGTDGCAGPFDIAVSNTPTTCTFKATPNQENLGLGTNPALTDTITVFAHGDLANPPTDFSATSNPVSVTSSDAPSSAKTSPGAATTTNACVTLAYNATVQNTSGADETIFLNTLHDSNGVDLTTTSSAVLSTTCNSAANPFPAAGLAPGTGTPPTSGGSYNCTFSVQVCGTPAAGAEQFGTGVCNGTAGSPGACTNPGGVAPAGGCTANAQCDTTCTGLSHSEQLNAGLTGDDSNPPDVISPIVNATNNVTECVSSFQTTQ